MTKKAQASDFVSWIFTTLLIIVLILILLFFVNASILKKFKLVDSGNFRSSDFVVGESLLAYAVT